MNWRDVCIDFSHFEAWACLKIDKFTAFWNLTEYKGSKEDAKTDLEIDMLYLQDWFKIMNKNMDLPVGKENEERMADEIDQTLYQELQPILLSAWNDFMEAGLALKEFGKLAYDTLGSRGKPYLREFIKEQIREGNVPKKRMESSKMTATQMGKQLAEIEIKLEERVSREDRFYLLTEISKGENVLLQSVSQSPEWKVAVRVLTKMYIELNHQLGIICQEIGYPPHQWEWPDSKPLEILAKMYMGIEITDWYQRQLGMILQPVDHPWYRVIKT